MLTMKSSSFGGEAMKYAAVSAVVLLSLGVAHAQSRTESVILNGKPCTRTTDDNGNVATVCGSNNRVQFGQPAQGFDAPDNTPPNTGFTPPSPPQPAPNGLPDWTQPRSQQSFQSQQGPNLASVLVGRWHYTATIKNVPVEVIVVFGPDSSYTEYVRITRREVVGNQVMTERGHYAVSGDALRTTPSEITVINGPRPNQLCNMQTQKCFTPPLTESEIGLQLVNADTISGELEGAQFTAQRMR